MLKHLAAYGAAAVSMLALDLLWLGVIAKFFCRDGIGRLMADPPNLLAGRVFYLLDPAGFLFFAVVPAAWYGVLAAPADLPRSRAILALA